jgi:PspA-Associated protein
VIVRILGDVQYRVPDTERAALEALDRDLVAAVDAKDDDAFTKALSALVDAVRQAGEAVPADDIAPSDLVVPFADATLAETEELLADSKDAGSDEP